MMLEASEQAIADNTRTTPSKSLHTLRTNLYILLFKKAPDTSTEDKMYNS